MNISTINAILIISVDSSHKDDHYMTCYDDDYFDVETMIFFPLNLEMNWFVSSMMIISQVVHSDHSCYSQ